MDKNIQSKTKKSIISYEFKNKLKLQECLSLDKVNILTCPDYETKYFVTRPRQEDGAIILASKYILQDEFLKKYYDKNKIPSRSIREYMSIKEQQLYEIYLKNHEYLICRNYLLIFESRLNNEKMHQSQTRKLRKK